MAVGAGAGEPVGEVMYWILVAYPAIHFSRVPGGGMADGEHGGPWRTRRLGNVTSRSEGWNTANKQRLWVPGGEWLLAVADGILTLAFFVEHNAWQKQEDYAGDVQPTGGWASRIMETDISRKL